MRGNAVFAVARHDAIFDDAADGAAVCAVGDNAEYVAIDLAAVDRDLGGRARAGHDIDSAADAAARISIIADNAVGDKQLRVRVVS